MTVSSVDKHQGFKKKIKRIRRRITYSDGFINILAGCGWLFFKFYFFTLKIRYECHPSFLETGHKGQLFGFWHGRQFLLVPFFGKWHSTIMVDVSWIGSIIATLLQKYGYQITRGSSKRKGMHALLCMKKAIERGSNVGVALDGPRGPIYKSKPGIIFLAKKTRNSIIPIATHCDNSWVLNNTWDRYQIPKPFSKCRIVLGEPVYCSTGDNELTTDLLDNILNDWQDKVNNVKFFTGIPKNLEKFVL
ncbi:lysophospholipid acyltransferase family protein [bacterium]|nr:lysophospholipid acyltransferase family protein [bacterium]